MKRCTKAIIAVAGYGTRRLPVTKVIEKCMLPLLNRPVVDYAVEDCIKAGITDIYFVVGVDSNQLHDYYARRTELEEYLKERGKPDLLASIVPPRDVTFHFISQDVSDGRYGTAIPVWLCRDYVDDDERVVVVMGDQTLYRHDGTSEVADLISAVETHDVAGGLVGVPVPREQIHRYGIIETDQDGRYERIIEHPSLDETTSDLNNASIYCVPRSFFTIVAKQVRDERTQEGEYSIVDAMNMFVADSNQLHVVRAKGTYLDCGSLDNWVRANSWLLEQTTNS